MNDVQLETARAVVFHRVTTERCSVSLLQLTRLIRREIVGRGFTAMVVIVIVLGAPLEVDTRAVHDVTWCGLVLRCTRW